jgi:hypothetical protein
MRTPCTCAEHKNGAVVIHNNHAFTREERQHETLDLPSWRWTCSCGGRGQFRVQSPNVAYHAWLRHVAKAGPS